VIVPSRRRTVFSSAADLEVSEAALWYDEQRFGLGEEFLAAIHAAANAAAHSPQLYARVHRKLRRILVHRFPYALTFRETQDELLIVSCHHLHRDPEVWRSRG
jgi:hypothetical protein